MPTVKMTARSVAALKPPTEGQIDYFDETLPGFGMRLSYGGTKAWVLLYRHNGLKRRMKIGTYPALPLATARRKAQASLSEVALGNDPGKAKAAYLKSETVDDLARDYLEKHARVKKRSWQHDERTLRNDVLPAIGKLKAKDIKRRDIIHILDKVKERSPIMANRTLEIVRKMFNWGISRDIVETNPCLGIVRPSEEHRRERVLTADEIRRFWDCAREEHSKAGLAFRLLLLTSQREGEVLSMRWQDIDEGTEWWWTIPGEFSKNRLAHRVPLSAPVIALLKEIQIREPDPTFVFPRRGGGSAATKALLRKPLARIRVAAHLENFVPHDLRRTAASFMTGMGIPRLTVAKVLNHAEAGVTSVYDRHSYDAEKRHALEVWAARLEEIVEGKPRAENVVSLATGTEAQ
jgi:integrase